MNKYHLCLPLKEITGATVLEYLNNVRLSKAHSLLMDTGYSMEKLRVNRLSSSLNLTRVLKRHMAWLPHSSEKGRNQCAER